VWLVNNISLEQRSVDGSWMRQYGRSVSDRRCFLQRIRKRALTPPLVLVLLLAYLHVGSPLALSGVSSTGTDQHASVSSLYDPVDLTKTGLLRYIFRSAVDVGQESQDFYFTVPANSSYVPNGPYLTASLEWSPLGSMFSDLDLSVWNLAGDRTGGRTMSEAHPEASIPDSLYLPSFEGQEAVHVGNVSQSNEGHWRASVYCLPSSPHGAVFSLVISIMLRDRIGVFSDCQSFEFNVPSNVHGLSADLEHLESFDFDLSLWDGFGRRTGGTITGVAEISNWIPNAVYSPSTVSSESVVVEPVRSTDDTEHSGEMWRAAAHCLSGPRSGYFSLTITLVFDSDHDGVIDSMDIDPVADLCVRLVVKKLKHLDPIDEGNNIWDPYILFGIGTSVAVDKVEAGSGDAWGSNIWSRSIKPIALNSDFEGEYSMWKNVPDDSRTVPLLIQVWDDDGRSRDDICDISPRPGGGDERRQDSSTLHITYDLLSHRIWGDVDVGYSSGEMDGSLGSIAGNDEDDVAMTFQITTERELSYVERTYLARKYAPVLHLDEREDSGPLEIWSMLNQSELRRSGAKDPLVLRPVHESYLILGDDRLSLRLREFDVSSYRNVIYARTFTSDNDTVVLQYWFFYLYDSLSPHQGDWEMIQLVFEQWSRRIPVEELVPATAAYSQHYEGEVKEWSDDTVLKSDTRPHVYVELGGHASMFSGPEVPNMTYPICMMSPSPWLEYAGKWGSSSWKLGPGGNSVQGPVYRASMERNWMGKPTSPIAYMWHEPLYWMERLL
jgi:hypothetical protein